MTVVVYCMSEYIAMILNKEKLVAKPALHYLMSYTTCVILKTVVVKAAATEVSA